MQSQIYVENKDFQQNAESIKYSIVTNTIVKNNSIHEQLIVVIARLFVGKMSETHIHPP